MENRRAVIYMSTGYQQGTTSSSYQAARKYCSINRLNLVIRLNNSDKGAISHAIFHRALWEYLAQVGQLEDEELQEKLRREIFEGYLQSVFF